MLAATFAALGVIPILFLAQLAFIVAAFGVLLDTFVVRSLLVPMATYDLGRRIWWPSRLARSDLDAAPNSSIPAAGGRDAPVAAAKPERRAGVVNGQR